MLDRGKMVLEWGGTDIAKGGTLIGGIFTGGRSIVGNGFFNIGGSTGIGGIGRIQCGRSHFLSSFLVGGWFGKDSTMHEALRRTSFKETFPPYLRESENRQLWRARQIQQQLW
jgi:hypothetical protein